MTPWTSGRSTVSRYWRCAVRSSRSPGQPDLEAVALVVTEVVDCRERGEGLGLANGGGVD